MSNLTDCVKSNSSLIRANIQEKKWKKKVNLYGILLHYYLVVLQNIQSVLIFFEKPRFDSSFTKARQANVDDSVGVTKHVLDTFCRPQSAYLSFAYKLIIT